MAIPSELLIILQQGALGAVVGYGTNWLAIKLLFQPYRRKRFGPFSIGPGVFIRHQERLAREVSRIAAESILTVETLQRKLASPALREYFGLKLREFLIEKLDGEYGPLAELFPAELQREYRELVLFARGKLRDTVAAYLGSPAFLEIAGGTVSDTLESIGSRKLSELLEGENREKLVELAHKLFVLRLTDAGSSNRAEDFSKKLLTEFFADTRPLREILPQQVGEGIAHKLKPVIAKTLSDASRTVDLDPLANAFRNLLQKYTDEFLRPQNSGFFKRIVNDTISRLKGKEIEAGISKFADSLPDWFRDYLRTEEGVRQGADLVHRAINSLLDMSPSEIWQKLGEETQRQLAANTAELLTALLVSRPVSLIIAQYIEVAISGMVQHSINDMLRQTGMEDPRQFYEKAGELVAASLRSEEATDRLQSRISQLFRSALEKPLGRPSRFVPDRARESVAKLLNDIMFDYLSLHSAQLVASLEIEKVIYRKIAEWEPRELHEMVERAAHDNLRWLEILGGLIGFVVGTLFGVALLII